MNKLKQMREAKGLSQSQLAKKSGVNIRLIQYYEQSYRDINKGQVATILKLADALECDVRDIIEVGTH